MAGEHGPLGWRRTGDTIAVWLGWVVFICWVVGFAIFGYGVIRLVVGGQWPTFRETRR